ncbi:MAG: hypothetical protein KDH88_08555 [Chromatiales bacterium]|nr:hypothetical protein [Chromatiales bacterium]
MKRVWAVLMVANIGLVACGGPSTKGGADEPLLKERYPVPAGMKPSPPMPWDPGYGQQPREVPAHMIPSKPESESTPFGNPAVFELVQQAERSAKAQEWSRADASLERALRLEPDNPYLWFRRASFELRRGLTKDAMASAAKSNSLAGKDRRLRVWNWELIADVQRRMGNEAGVRAAEAQAEKLRNKTR